MSLKKNKVKNFPKEEIYEKRKSQKNVKKLKYLNKKQKNKYFNTEEE